QCLRTDTCSCFSLFFFSERAAPQIYTLSLHDALPIFGKRISRIDGPVKATGAAKYSFDINRPGMLWAKVVTSPYARAEVVSVDRSEEHTSELQSRFDLVCRLLLEKKNKRCNIVLRDVS